MTSFVSAGVYDRDLIGPVLDFLEESLEDFLLDYSRQYYFCYGNYYASQAFFHAEAVQASGALQRYYDTVSRHLLADQQEDGRWINDLGPGDAYGTGSACILLQMPNQYLPIFQR